MAKAVISPEQEKFIQDNFLKMGSPDLAKATGLTKAVVSRYKKANSLIVPPEIVTSFKSAKQRGKTIATPEQDQFIIDNYLTIPVKRMAKILGFSESTAFKRVKRLGLVIPEGIKQERRMANQFKTGDEPVNKGKKQTEFMSPDAIARTLSTRFQKGNVNHNTTFDGKITVRDRKWRGKLVPAKFIRIAKGVWKELQIHNWERVNGSIPDGHILACLDGDYLNCDVSNWILMTKADNARRNSGCLNLPDTYVAGLMAKNGRQVDPELKDKILQHPEFINLKRHQILLQRAIKNGK